MRFTCWDTTRKQFRISQILTSFGALLCDEYFRQNISLQSDKFG